MGNCMNVVCHKNAEKSRVIFYNGKQKEFKSSTPVKKITSGRYGCCKIVHQAFPFSPLPLDSKLEAGELYYLMPPLVKHCSPKYFPKLANQKQKIKIVLTIEQLDELLGNGIEFKSKGVSLQFSESFQRKWLPSLSSIQEEQQF